MFPPVGDSYADGWYPDPWQRWPERWYGDGTYTERVRSGQAEGRDPIPVAPAPPAPGYGTGPGYDPYRPYQPYQPPGQWGQPGWGYGYQQPKVGTAATGPLPLHPMNLGDIVDGAFRLYRANFKTIVTIVAVVSGPVQLLAAFARRNEFGGNSIFTIFSNPSAAQDNGTSNTSATTSLFVAFLGLFILPYAAGAISRVVSASYLGSAERPGQALRAAGRRFISLLVAWVLIHVLEVVAFVLIILPGLIVMSLSVCVAPAIVLEGLGAMAGIRRSWSLNRHRMWRVMGISLLTGLLVSIIGGIVSEPFALAGLAIGLHWGWILLFIGNLTASLVTVSLTAIIATLIYFDGRIRYEGMDLQILAGPGGGWTR